MYKTIPVYNIEENTWIERSFETKDSFHKFVLNQFKIPGNYNLKYTKFWKDKGNYFSKNQYYIASVKNSRDYIKFWNSEKQKCDIYGGVIYIHPSDGLEYFVPGPYYFYLNFCPIYERIKKMEQFPDVWDSDYHFFLYITLCLLEGKHSIVLKKRQAGYSFKHGALLLLNTWFGKRQTNKIFAFKNDYVESTWNFIMQYRNHLNRNTGWYRNFSPDKTLDWWQRVEITENGKKTWRGSFNILKGFTTKDDPAKGVGGSNSFVYGEEAGVNSGLGKTHEYLLPAVKLGHISTGLIMYSGSVGELKDCEPLKDMFYKCEVNGFRPVENIWDEDSAGQECGFFVPEYWNHVECMDEDGNSDIEKAKQICGALREEARKKSPEQYRLYISQHPFSPSEAFAVRSESRFPLHLIEKEILKIKNENLHGTVVDLYYDTDGKIKHSLHSRSRPVVDFPIKADSHKEGAVVIYDFPESGAPHGLYFAGVDPVRDLKTDYSSSLASCYILKRSVEKGGFIEPEKVVACYTGRFDDPDMTHETMCKLIEFYNAKTLVENDVDTFIRYMMSKKKQKYLISKQDLAVLHEMDLNVRVYAVYGMTGTQAVANRLLQTIIDYLKEEFTKIYDTKTGELVRVVRGVNYIKDLMLLTEMKEWVKGLNTDRLKAFGYALMAATSHSTHYSYKQKTEEDTQLDYIQQNLEINKNIQRSAFTRFNKHSTPFKSLR